jgi:ribose 5-phosphate isomerase A
MSATIEKAKKAVGKQAANLVKDGMVLGLGTGSTAAYFIEALIARVRAESLNIQVVATSEMSLKLARQGNLPLAPSDTLSALDLTVDSADAIDADKQMIKGGGGALLREKIVATMSREVIIIVDETKLVTTLNTHPLPVEIIPFCPQATIGKIKGLGYTGRLRLNPSGTPYLTDNHNYLYDVAPDPKRGFSAEDHLALVQIPGVVETGLFFAVFGRVIVGFLDGTTAIR